MSIPEELKYTREHEWLRITGDTVVVGITEYAAGKLGDIVYVDLPAEGASVTTGKVVGELESTKSVGELFAPVDGTVVAVNQAAADDPSIVNADPYGEGWLVTLRVEALPELLDAAGYRELLAGESA